MHEITGVPRNLPSEETNSSELQSDGGFSEPYSHPTTSTCSNMLGIQMNAQTAGELEKPQDHPISSEIPRSEMTMAINNMIQCQNPSVNVQREKMVGDRTAASGNQAAGDLVERRLKPMLPARQSTEEHEQQSILALPIDSLHWLASFLTPFEWSNFGQCNRVANRICREIFKRVQMHGFRCATEVVTSWVSGAAHAQVLAH